MSFSSTPGCEYPSSSEDMRGTTSEQNRSSSEWDSESDMPENEEDVFDGALQALFPGTSEMLLYLVVKEKMFLQGQSTQQQMLWWLYLNCGDNTRHPSHAPKTFFFLSKQSFRMAIRYQRVMKKLLQQCRPVSWMSTGITAALVMNGCTWTQTRILVQWLDAINRDTK